jgi:MFS family permease
MLASGLIFGIGTVLGPVIGGVFEKVTWRWAFYINLIIGAVFTPVYLFLIPSFHPAPNTKLKDRAKQFDTIGAILSIGALILIIMAINFGGTLFAWNSAATITIFVIGILMVIAFGLQQSFNLLTSPSNRMFPVHFIRNKEAVLLFICTAACNSMVFIPIYYIPILFQFTRADSALESAVRLLPLIFLLSTAIIANGFFMAKFGYYMPWYAGGAALGLIANVLLCSFSQTFTLSCSAN